MARSPLSRPEPVHGWLLFSLFALAISLVPMPAWIVDEFYSRDLYPFLQRWVTAATNLLPFAALDALLVLGLALVILRLTRAFRLARQCGIFAALSDLARRVVRVAAVLSIAFVCAWGCNYRRIPLAETLPAGSPGPSTENLVAMVGEANILAASLRPAVVAGSESTYDRLAISLPPAINAALGALNRTPLARPGRPKFSLLLTPYFTWAGINGMVNPLGLETIVHPDLLPFERPFILAHEWAHLAGHADEAEASAVGWLACMRGDAPLAYSASLYLIMEADAALPGDERRRVRARLDAGVRVDLAAISARLQKQQPQVQRAATRVYDQFLKANRVEDGARSYGRALTLILASPFREALSTYQRR